MCIDHLRYMNVVIVGSSTLTAGNIKNGVTIFGVTGNYVGWVSGTFTILSGSSIASGSGLQSVYIASSNEWAAPVIDGSGLWLKGDPGGLIKQSENWMVMIKAPGASGKTPWNGEISMDVTCTRSSNTTAIYMGMFYLSGDLITGWKWISGRWSWVNFRTYSKQYGSYNAAPTQYTTQPQDTTIICNSLMNGSLSNGTWNGWIGFCISSSGCRNAYIRNIRLNW